MNNNSTQTKTVTLEQEQTQDNSNKESITRKGTYGSSTYTLTKWTNTGK